MCCYEKFAEAVVEGNIIQGPSMGEPDVLCMNRMISGQMSYARCVLRLFPNSNSFKLGGV